MKTRSLIIFVKAPIPGLVKTRLARDIGNEKACDLYRAFCLKILKEVNDVDADIEIHYYPENELNLIRTWLGNNYSYFPQNGKDLGKKMKNSIKNSLERGYEKVILTGSDIPDLEKEIIISGFNNIDNRPVIGPCMDGGYYLIGFDKNSFNPDFFKDIPWSTGRVLKQTMKRMKNKNLTPYLLKELNDIDTIEDLRQSEFRD